MENVTNINHYEIVRRDWRKVLVIGLLIVLVGLIISIYFSFIHDGLGICQLEGWQKLVIGALLTTIIWVVATFVTPPDDDKTLQNFVNKVNPGGPGWSRFTSPSSEPWPVPKGILSMVLGCLAVYGSLLGTGQFIYGHTNSSMILFTVALLSSISLFKLQKK